LGHTLLYVRGAIGRAPAVQMEEAEDWQDRGCHVIAAGCVIYKAWSQWVWTTLLQ
jgi:hypothetical protein